MKRRRKPTLLRKVERLKQKGIIGFDRENSGKFMEFSGDLGEVLTTLDDAFGKTRRDRNLDFFLYANRLLSGIIDYGLSTGANVLDTKHLAEDFCLSLYKGKLKQAREYLEEIEFSEAMLRQEVVEKADPISWAAFDPALVKELIRKMKKADLRIDYIALDGHDAYRPGLMIAAAFDSGIVAIRNAQDSKRDSHPRPLRDEREFLNRYLNRRNILVYGEDASTGTAINSLYDFIIKTTNPRRITTASTIFIPGSDPKTPIDFYAVERNIF
ncbi:hypothetical protein GF386_00945 [Candidatus Pacearchaeota archaeon]|nr:hypothetical protein [Candidatus Pacearchaeota archaeon]